MSITQLDISLNRAQEDELRAQEFYMVPGNLNKGTGGNEVHLWYKDQPGDNITRIQFSYTPEMAKGLSEAGYNKINKNLNAGTSGPDVYMWYFRGKTNGDFPIKRLHVSTDADNEAQMLQSGFERLTCDLNHLAGGNWVYLWVEREKTVYISDIQATTSWSSDVSLLKKGYTRIDDNTNKFVEKDPVYIWYLKTAKEEEAIKDLQLSHNSQEYTNLQQRGYTVVNMDLNQGTRRDQMFLWFKKDGYNPITSMGSITNRVVSVYERVGSIIREMYKLKILGEVCTFYLYFQR